MSSPREEEARRNSLGMAWLLLAAVLLGGVGWQATLMWRGDGVIVSPPRTVIVATVDGMPVERTLRTDLRVMDDLDVQLTYWVEPKADAEYDWQEGPVTLTFVGDEEWLRGVRCGDSEPLTEVTYSDSSAGLKRAVDADLASATPALFGYAPEAPTSTAASGPDPDDADGPTSASPDDFDYFAFTAQMAPNNSDIYYRGRWPVDDYPAMWVEVCTLPAQMVWSKSGGAWFDQNYRSTLALPEIDFVPSGAEQDDTMLGMSGWVVVPRGDRSITLAHPEPTVTTSGWAVEPEVHEDSGSLFYAPPPTLVFENRASTGKREVILIGLSVAAGAGGTALVQAARGFWGR